MDSINVTPPSVLYVGIEVKQCIHFFKKQELVMMTSLASTSGDTVRHSFWWRCSLWSVSVSCQKHEWQNSPSDENKWTFRHNNHVARVRKRSGFDFKYLVLSAPRPVNTLNVNIQHIMLQNVLTNLNSVRTNKTFCAPIDCRSPQN